MPFLMIFLLAFDPGLVKAHENPIPREIKTVIDVGPYLDDYFAAKLVLDLHIHKIKYGTNIDDAISLVPTACLNHVTYRDLWQVLTYYTNDTYKRIHERVARRMAADKACKLDRKHWIFWVRYLI